MTCSHSGPLMGVNDILAADHCALVVVDIQNDFVHPDGFTARAGGDVTPSVAAVQKVNEAIALFRERGVPTIFLREVVRRETLLDNFLARCGSYDACPAREGTWGSELYADLTPPRDVDPVVEKPAYDGFNESRLDQTLRHYGVRTCVYAGFASNVCVEATARHGFERGYYSVLLRDASAGDSIEAHSRCIDMWSAFYGPVVAVADLAAIWQEAPGRE
jgi:nicotinamidase-related amidase